MQPNYIEIKEYSQWPTSSKRRNVTAAPMPMKPRTRSTTASRIERACGLDHNRSEQQVSAVCWACLELEPTEGAGSRWVPRPGALTLDDEDDVDVLAKIFALKAVEGYAPVPGDIVKDCRDHQMRESGELAQVVITREAFACNATHWHTFASDEIYWRVFDRTCELLNELSKNIEGLWWLDPEPELPFDADPPHVEIRKDENRPPSKRCV